MIKHGYKLAKLCLLTSAVALTSTTVHADSNDYEYPTFAKVDFSKYFSHSFFNRYSSRTVDRPITDDIFYFVLPDRFENGKTSNDQGDIAGTKFDNGLDPTDKAFYHGGDLDGLIKKLRYIKGMGVTALWIAPVFKNDPVFLGTAGYHGYWPLDFTQIDPHFGTNETFKKLVKKAHNMGIKVFLDVVVNHTGDRILIEECHNQDGTLKDGLTNCPYQTLAEKETNPYTPFIQVNKDADKSPAWLNDPSYYHNQGESTFNGESSVYGDFVGLDDLKTEDPAVVEGMVDIFKFWISEFKIDGFRMDTVKHVNKSFWQQWTPAIMEHAKSEGIDNFHIFGEVFDGDPRNISEYTKSGKIPSALDFGTYYPAQRVFTGQSAPADFLWALERDDMYTDEDTTANSMLNFVSNHDVGRLGHFIEQNLPDATEDEKLDRLKLAHAYMFFGRGVPVIYYGDEQGFTGGGDADGREDMMASSVQEYNDNNLIGSDQSTADNNFNKRHPMYRAIRTYSYLYKRHNALRNGHQIVRFADDTGPGILALSRVAYDLREHLVVFNTSTEEKSVTLDTTADSYIKVYGNASHDVDDDSVNVTVEPLSFVILRGNQRIANEVENLSATLNIPSVNGIVNGLVELGVDLSNQDQTIPLNRVSFSVSTDGENFSSLGSDYTPGYKVFWDTSEIEFGTFVTIRAEVESVGLEDPIIMEESVTVDQIEGMTIKFQKPESWSGANIYFFDSAAPSPAWPGNAMRHHGDGWYSYQFPEGVQSATVIFNDGNGNQTENLVRQGSDCYSGGAWVGDCDLPFNVTFKKPDNWGDSINVHYWDAGIAGGTAWPGMSMTELGAGFYEYSFPTGATSANIIFNDNGGNQTENLYRDGSGCYDIVSNSWADECELPSGPLGEIYVRGGMNGWSVDNPIELVSDTVYRTTVDLTVGTVEFKIASADWSVALGDEADGSIVFGAEKTLEPGVNLVADITTAGSYTFEVDATNPAIPLLNVFITGPYGDTTLYLRGDMNGWSTDDAFTYNFDGTYSTTETLAAGTYNFKIADASWSVGTNFGSHFENVDANVNVDISKDLQDQSASNLVLTVATDGDYTFTLDATTDEEGEILTEPRLTISN